MSSKSMADSKEGRPIAGNQAFLISDEDLPMLENSALQGSLDAAFKVYQFYELVKLDPQKSLYWVTIAAENGHPIGQYNLALTMLYDPNMKNIHRAKFWLKQSASQGDEQALERLKEIEAKKSSKKQK